MLQMHRRRKLSAVRSELIELTPDDIRASLIAFIKLSTTLGLE